MTRYLPVLLLSFFIYHSSFAFEGRIAVTITRGGQTETLLYTADTNHLRIERGENDRPYPKDIVSRDDGEIILLFPNNRSFVRLQPGAENQSVATPTFPGMPPGLGPQAQASDPARLPIPGTIGPTNISGMPAMPQMPQMPMASGAVTGVGPQVGTGTPNMPAMPMMPMEQAELKATRDTTNLLGYTCTRYELRQRGEVMEIWATDKLLPFQAYLQNQPHRFGPRMLEEQWGGLLKSKKLFPLLAVLRFERLAPGSDEPSAPGPERLRFEVTAITPEKITYDTLFQPPPDYQEIQPLPF